MGIFSKLFGGQSRGNPWANLSQPANNILNMGQQIAQHSGLPGPGFPPGNSGIVGPQGLPSPPSPMGSFPMSPSANPSMPNLKVLAMRNNPMGWLAASNAYRDPSMRNDAMRNQARMPANGNSGFFGHLFSSGPRVQGGYSPNARSHSMLFNNK